MILVSVAAFGKALVKTHETWSKITNIEMRKPYQNSFFGVFSFLFGVFSLRCVFM